MAGITGKIDFNEKLILSELPVNGENNMEKHFEFCYCRNSKNAGLFIVLFFDCCSLIENHFR
jgi:hypothetical protein